MQKGLVAQLKQRMKFGLMAAVFMGAQLGFAAVPFLPPAPAQAAQQCVSDTAGANDEPGQKDLTRLCVDTANLPNSQQVIWNWDELGTSGNNSMDACGLFDTDGDAKINYSICITTSNIPATLSTVTIYSCGDAKTDRCTSQVNTVSGPYATSCTVTQQATDPFPAGAAYPTDTVATCNFVLSDVGQANAVLTDVCSYPSREPNSDPSDCVIIQDSPVALVELIKDLVPANDAGRFNLTIDGPGNNDTNTVTNQGDGGTTGIVGLNPGNSPQGSTATVSEAAYTGTDLSKYSKSISCIKRGTSTAVVATGSGASWTIPIKNGDNIVCTITNTAAGSIKIVKNAIPNNLTDFGFTASGTGVSNFTLDDDAGVSGADMTYSNEKLFSNLAAGQYTFTETEVAGWDLTDISCPNTTISKNTINRTVTVTLAAGQNVTCTFENKQRAQIIVTKQTNPDGDAGQFSITANGTGTIEGSATRTISDNGTQTYVVSHGTYSISEQDQANWSEDTSQCQNLTINGNTPLVNGIPTVSCTITNTKLGSLTIIKNALPDNEQDFLFNVTNLSGGSFYLDDDADPTLANQKAYNNLPAGSYSVSEQSTPGWSLTSLVCDNQTVEGATASVTLTPGQNKTCTFTNTKLGSISGVKYTADANGSLGPVLSGWTIYIDSNNDGEFNDGEQSDITDSNGAYSFGDLLPGTYALLEVLQNGWTQIFSPTSVELDAGENSTGNNFGNFQNGSIGGFKWNDKNANGTVNEGEEKLNGWVITLFTDNEDIDTDLNNQVSQTTTAGEGTYNFPNLVPGTYSVCETQQQNWVQTYPTNNSCHTITIDQSGESNQANFGNQGRGSIKVIKNVDSDGDGTIDSQDVANWKWDIDGSGDYATGSSGSQSVAAGTYTVSEQQKDNYHVTTSSCSGETEPTTPTESLDVTVSPGETVTCTFTNTRDTAFITVNKNVNPTTDTGNFNLHIDGEKEFTASNVTHGGTTGQVRVPTGTYTVSETVGTGTNLSDYTSTNTCEWTNSEGGTRGGGENGTSISNLTVAKGESLVCTFTNVRKGSITIIKDAQPNSTQPFTFTGSLGDPSIEHGPHFILIDDGVDDIKDRRTFTGLESGTYTVTEPTVKDWDLDSIVCQGGIDAKENNRSAVVKLEPGENVTCTFTNTKRAELTIEKDAKPADGTDFNFSLVDMVPTDIAAFVTAVVPTDPDEDFLLDDDNDDALSNTKTFTNLPGGTYEVTEKNLPAGWNLTDIDCEGTQNFSRNGNTLTLTIANGDEIHCTFENKKDSTVVVNKYNDLNRNGWQDESEPALPNWEFTLDEVEGAYNATQTTSVLGQTTFNNVTPDSSFTLTENLADKEGWHLSSIYCDDEWEYASRYVEGDADYLYTRPGETVTCNVGNYKDAELVISKTNNQTGPVRTGTTVSYTVVVSVPEDSGAVFDAVVRDILPAGFTYVPGSWTSTSPETTDPEFDPIGEWAIGDLYPGDSVTLTYKATINASVTPGTYKNIAYAEGCPIEDNVILLARAANERADCEEPVSTDFVESSVTVFEPQVLGSSTSRATPPQALVDTGDSLSKSIALSMGIILLTLGLFIASRRQFAKGTN